MNHDIQLLVGADDAGSSWSSNNPPGNVTRPVLRNCIEKLEIELTSR